MAGLCWILRADGSKREWANEMLECSSSRLAELQAAMLRMKLRHRDRLGLGRASGERVYDAGHIRDTSRALQP